MMSKDLAISKKWAIRAIFRAQSGLSFLKEVLERLHRSGTDVLYSRSVYLLLSYSCELIFDAYLLLGDAYIGMDESQLMELIKGRGGKPHNLVKLSDTIGEDKLQEIGIKSVKSKNDEGIARYTIYLSNGKEILVEDIVEVRYDFKYDYSRNADPNESERMQMEVEALLEVVSKIMAKLPEDFVLTS